MRKKNALLVSLVIPLFLGMAIPMVGAQTAVVSVEPDTVTVDIGDTFQVNITIANVTDLNGFDIMLYWDNTLLECIDAVMTPPAAWVNRFYPPGVEGINQNYSTTQGRYWNACTALPPVPFNGTIVVATLTFNATALGGPSSLTLYQPGYPYPVKLSDSDGNRIPCTGEDGEVTVVPEFPAALIMPLFMVATLAAVILRKKVWPRKRKIPFVAE